MKVLITGGAGFVGSHLADELLARGLHVAILDNGSPAKIRHLAGNPSIQFVQDTIFNMELLEAMIAESDLIYHLAAVVGVAHYVDNPYQVLDVNVNGTHNVLKAAFKHRKKVVFGSTSEVYGRNPKVPWTEDDDRVLGATRIDRWCYSTSKAAGEHFCFAYSKMGLPVTVLRYFNIYGPRLDQLETGRVVTVFVGQALRGQPLTVVGDGTQTRCFTYITDAIKATVTAGIAENTSGQVFNVGTDVETRIVDLAREVIALTASSSSIRFIAADELYGSNYEDIPRRAPNVDKMHRLLGVRAQVGLRYGLRQTITALREECTERGFDLGA